MATCLGDQKLSDSQVAQILEKANDWALTNGLVYKPNQTPEGQNQAQCAPFALFPSVVPRRLWQQARDCMEDFNTLMYTVAQDHHFLEQCFTSVIKVDPFVRNLWEVYTTVRVEGMAQPLSLDCYRNDFMMRVTGNLDPATVPSAGIPPSSQLQLKQIEFNTIAAASGGLVTALTRLHKYTLDLAKKQYTPEEMPDNAPVVGLAKGLVKAWELYNNAHAVILVLVSEADPYIFDQRWLEFHINHLSKKVDVVRATFLEVHDRGRLSEDKKLLLDDLEVAVVYLRTGYAEHHYPSDKEWSARLLMERSAAIKCPTVRSQLSGCKKVQQELARPGAVERFIQDPAAVSRIRDTFAGQYGLEQGPEGDEAVKMAMKSPGKFVLKPQREGGGHNLYGEELKAKLETIGHTEEREAYILMERIFPLPEKNYLVKAGVGLPLQLSDTVSEMGTYGVHIGDGQKAVANYVCGHLVKTKTQGTDEGGILVGLAVLDTPFLVDV